MKDERVLRLEAAKGSKVTQINFDPDGMTIIYHFENGSTYTFVDASSEAFKREAEVTYKRAGVARNFDGHRSRSREYMW